ncbi:MAG: hypothetical protein U0787_08795 [Polyangia bacterium]
MEDQTFEGEESTAMISATPRRSIRNPTACALRFSILPDQCAACRQNGDGKVTLSEGLCLAAAQTPIRRTDAPTATSTSPSDERASCRPIQAQRVDAAAVFRQYVPHPERRPAQSLRASSTARDRAVVALRAENRLFGDVEVVSRISGTPSLTVAQKSI